MEPTSRFVDILGDFPEETQEKIEDVVPAKYKTSAQLRAVVRGRNIDQATALLHEELGLSKMDASALAGVLLASSAPTQATATAPDQIQPILFASGAVRRVEVELKLTGIPIQCGLEPNGSRQFVNDLVNSIVGVEIDGFVMRIPTHDLKLVIRGTGDDVIYVLQQIRGAIPDSDIEEVRNTYYHTWPPKPSFKIVESTSTKAVKSDYSDDKFENKSMRSNSSAGSRT